MTVESFNKLMEGYNVADDFLPEELSIFSDMQVILELVRSKNYIGETNIIRRPNDRCRCAYNGVPEVCDECPKDKIPAMIRSSLAAACLRNIRDNLNKLEIK